MQSRLYPFLFLVLMFLTAGCATRTTIANNVSEREANEIVVLLASQGIQAEKVVAPVTGVGAAATTAQNWDITVPSNQITEALSILNRSGLPRVKGTTLLDLFGAQGLVPSDMQDRIRYQEGLSEQLAMTIRKMDGIIDANVQITFPSDQEEGKTLTASVYVKHEGILDNPNSLLVTKIKRLVASAVPGLKIENVAVVTDRALFSDITYPSLTEKTAEERDFVSIWSVIVARESASLFRLIFYIFSIVLFLFICAFIWMLWKFYPILRGRGGFKAFFYPEQIDLAMLQAKETPPEEEIEKEEKP